MLQTARRPLRPGYAELPSPTEMEYSQARLQFASLRSTFPLLMFGSKKGRRWICEKGFSEQVDISLCFRKSGHVYSFIKTPYVNVESPMNLICQFPSTVFFTRLLHECTDVGPGKSYQHTTVVQKACLTMRGIAVLLEH